MGSHPHPVSLLAKQALGLETKGSLGRAIMTTSPRAVKPNNSPPYLSWHWQSLNERTGVPKAFSAARHTGVAARTRKLVFCGRTRLRVRFHIEFVLQEVKCSADAPEVDSPTWRGSPLAVPQSPRGRHSQTQVAQNILCLAPRPPKH